MRYRIVEEPRLKGGPVYKVQTRGCGPLAMFWYNQKTYTPYGSHTTYHATQKAAEEAMDAWRRYDLSKAKVVYEISCQGEHII